MKDQDVLRELEALGTEQNRRVYRRHGIGENQYGVSYANLRALRKRIKSDHSLARELWASENHDARVLATMIADPKRMNPAEMDDWADGLSNYVLADELASLVARTPHARAKMEEWIRTDGEWTERAGWLLLAHLAMKERALPDEFFETHLVTIERDLSSSKNRVRDAMNSALIAIGVRNRALEAMAVASAGRIGKVIVDHGETSCETPDAIGYIRRAWSRRE